MSRTRAADLTVAAVTLAGAALLMLAHGLAAAGETLVDFGGDDQ